MVSGKGRRHRERGQSTVEVALVLPVVVVFGMIVAQVGLVMIDVVLVHHAAREGARAAAVEPTAAAAEQAARASTRLDDQRLTIGLRGGTTTGDRLTVVVGYRSPTRLPLIGPLVPDVPLTAMVTMRVE